MGIMTMSAQKVFLLPIPVACPSSMDTRSPISQLGAMALAAQLVGFLKINQFTAGRMQHVTIIGIVAVHAPPVFFVMLKINIIVEIFQLPSFGVGFHVGMTLRTWEYTFG
jgi:hypothetical protein